MTDDDPVRCLDCDAPYERVRKWNSGHPMTFSLPTCTCEEDRTWCRLSGRLSGREPHR